ncbi:MAG: hydratase [Pseudomonadota bacterium]|nr:hydratase [Pseudomonadota bacterium]
MPISQEEAEDFAARILAAAEHTSSIPPLTDEVDLDLDDAYRIASAVARRRIGRGERPVGWKIGFTNRTIWDEYGVHAPIWGPIYDTTVIRGPGDAAPASCPLAGLLEPRIEPEIVFRMARAPHPDMDERELLDCVDAVGHGFELVQSLFSGWRFRAADTIAAFALHGCYRYGPLLPVDGPRTRAEWFTRLADFEVVLFRNEIEADRGRGENVLDGPLSALRHFVGGLAERPMGRGVEPGDLVTTGTVTRAFPVQPGERWSTRINGLPLPGMLIAFT